MVFDWDEEKSEQNKRKHGIGFEEAGEIWHGYYLSVDGVARSLNEEKRGATIGMVGGKLYTAIWTMRNGKTRLISVRRARRNEEKAFVISIR